MTAEWLHLPPPYPPGVGPLCGAELEAWYEDLQDILGSDAGGAKLARAPSYGEEPEFLDVLESCSLTWLTDGGQTWGEGVQRTTEQIHNAQPLHHTSSSATSCLTLTEERKAEARSSDGDLLPPEFFEFLSEGGMVDSSGCYYYHHHQQQVNSVHPASPSVSEEELPRVPDSPSCSSSSASQSPSQRCSSPSSPVSSPSIYSPPRLGKRRRSEGPDGTSSSPGASSQSQQRATSSYSSSYLSAKKSRKEREQENERKVQELTEQNERLKAEIERLGEEVQRTRRALIERLVNTKK
ncbi:DNA damage-inducible transcript 3 protein [Hippocampus zosterae]|uniref:DNA damage-inducible transcript 3 protein n=1 Tax=Hippocampus zosterae TaxID=109293 RepID=UPI00223D999F|nr:DNA damage-inducible transcript 3 protein [Hippocampus zosterae]XP_051931993.1 DNA damage-inducible transcript 3 protein [Hippocampus zosterae]